MRLRHGVILALLVLAGCSRGTGAPPPRLRVAFPGYTVHNGNYRIAAFLYQLQTLLGATRKSPNVLEDGIVLRTPKEVALDLTRLSHGAAELLQQIAAESPPADELGADELDAYMRPRYYELTRPYATLADLQREHPYRDNPEWMVIPVDSATFFRRRVLHIQKDRIADALATYFENGDRVRYAEGTVIVAESLDRDGTFVEAEVLRKRGDGFWNFAVYDGGGALAPHTVAFDEDGARSADAAAGFKVPESCALCHRVDRLDHSGDPEPPVRSPVRGFFHRLPAHVPQIHLGPEYYDHMAFTELTEATARAKDGVFGVYGSLLLSELAGRRRLGTLTPGDRARYARLQPYFPELLASLDRVDSVVNSLGMRLMRIPAPRPGVRLGAARSDPEFRADEEPRPAAIPGAFFMAAHEVSNATFRRFRPGHHTPPFRGVALDADDQPAGGIDHASAVAFVAWLNALPAEREAGRTYRLPTEDEWEHAARGGDQRRFPWGDRWPPPPGAGNLGGEESREAFRTDWEYLHGYRDPHPGAAPVGSFLPNPYFVHDLAGNVYEWTSTVYEQPAGAPAGAPDPRRPYGAGLRIIRGSSWGDELPKVLRCAFRNPVPPDTRWPFLGLRVVADIPALR